MTFTVQPNPSIITDLILSPQRPTTSLSLPTSQPYFILQSAEEIPSTPSTPGKNRPRGVRVIDYSISQQNDDLTRSTSENTFGSSILLTPENQFPINDTTLLDRQDRNYKNPSQSFSTSSSSSSPQVTFLEFSPRSESVVARQRHDEANSLKVNSGCGSVVPRFKQVQNQLQIHLNQSHEPLLNPRRPNTAFGKGEIIHHKFRQSAESFSEEDDDCDHEDSSSESSGFSSIIPQDQLGSKISMVDYWRLLDERLQKERQERQEIRRFSNNLLFPITSEAEHGKWVIKKLRTERFSTPPSHYYTCLSPDPWRTKPRKFKEIVYAQRVRASSLGPRAATRLVSALELDEMGHQQFDDHIRNNVISE